MSELVSKMITINTYYFDFHQNYKQSWRGIVFRNDHRIHRFILCQMYLMSRWFCNTPRLRQFRAVFAVAEVWLLCDIGWLVLSMYHILVVLIYMYMLYSFWGYESLQNILNLSYKRSYTINRASHSDHLYILIVDSEFYNYIRKMPISSTMHNCSCMSISAYFVRFYLKGVIFKVWIFIFAVLLEHETSEMRCATRSKSKRSYVNRNASNPWRFISNNMTKINIQNL